jgi:uncharacterized OB-fold protein
VPYKKPLPKPNSETKPFWDGCKKHQLKFQKCKTCLYVRWPPSIICPKCHSPEVAWILARGRGKIYTYAIFHQVFHKEFKNDIPYIVAVVELEEGPRLITNIIGCSPDIITCDMPVEVVWEDVTKKVSLPKFKPVINCHSSNLQSS